MERDSRGRVISPLKEIDGVVHRLCTGPAHDEPVWLPETDKYFYQHHSGKRKGKYISKCRLCVNWSKLKSPGLSGTVPVARVKAYFIEGINRVGMMEFCRRTGLSNRGIRDILDGYTTRVQKRTVQKVMLEVISMRRKHEVRHRDSIRAGAYLRGREEKEVKSRKDLYRPEGDEQAQAKLRQSKGISEEKKEEIKKKDRVRARRGRKAKARA